jgi:hypothetical protein
MDDIIITLFTKEQKFMCGYYINEIIETLNTPVIIDASDSSVGMEYLQEYNIPIYHR